MDEEPLDARPVDMIILLPGNHLPLTIPKHDIARMDKLIQDTVADPEKRDRWLFLNQGDYLRRVLPRAILGWYFRPHAPSDTQKAVDLMAKMEKKMPDPNQGEEWKNQE